MRKRFWLCCLLASPLVAVAAGVEEDPWLILEKAGQAVHKLSYKGIFVYRTAGAMSSMQITHMNYAQGEFSRVISLDGAAREMLRHGNEAVIYSPRNEKVMIEKRQVRSSFPAVLPTLTDALKNSYQARLVGQERVGGRDGVVVQLAPRDKLRYGYRFSVDREFGLLLKSVMLNERNEVVEQVGFSQLVLMPTTSMDWFRPNVDRSKIYEMEPEQDVSASTGASGDGWEVTQLPAGYLKVEQVRRNMPGKSQPVSQAIFSDGIATVSLFVEPLEKGALAKIGHLLQGATNIYANTIDGRQIIVVGDVPEEVVRQIGDSVSFKK